MKKIVDTDFCLVYDLLYLRFYTLEISKQDIIANRCYEKTIGTSLY